MKKRSIKRFMNASKDLRFSPIDSYFTYEKIKIGRNVFINKDAYFSGMISIGDDVMFGPGVFITDGYHEYKIPGKIIEDQGPGEKQEVIIENDVWVGAKSAIMKGVHIHEGTIIGTMSLVLKDMPPYCISVGNPCKPVKYRYSDYELEQHLLSMNKLKDEIVKTIKQREVMFNEFKRD